MSAAIETLNLTKVYRDVFRMREVHAVDDISLEVGRGTSYGLLGPNGAGKTTFVKLLLSVVQATQGSAKIFGQDARQAEARRPIGYLPENHRFPTYMTGTGMLDFFSSLSGLDYRSRRRRIPELLDLVGLAKQADVRLKKYSKGMLQRLGLAQAMLHSPSLLILDEPTDGVDPVGRRQIREILKELEGQGVTIFLNSHLLMEVELFCREVAILHSGRIALAGEVRDLTTGSGYRVAATQVPERLDEELRLRSSARTAKDGLVEFLFASRGEANEAVDLLRRESCEIEGIVRTRSTLEEVFMRTVGE